MVSALDSGLSSPGTLCSVLVNRHFIIAVVLSTQVYKLVLLN